MYVGGWSEDLGWCVVEGGVKTYRMVCVGGWSEDLRWCVLEGGVET